MGLQHFMDSELIVLKTSDKRSARKSSLQFPWLLFTAADITFGVGGDKQIFFIEILSGGGDSLCPLPLRRKKTDILKKGMKKAFLRPLTMK